VKANNPSETSKSSMDDLQLEPYRAKACQVKATPRNVRLSLGLAVVA
jgi:hypothetical protein